MLNSVQDDLRSWVSLPIYFYISSPSQVRLKTINTFPRIPNSLTSVSDDEKQLDF